MRHTFSRRVQNGSNAFFCVAVALIAACFATSVSAQGIEVKTSPEGMTYSIRMPASYNPADGGLLVVGFHGQGGSHSRFMQILSRTPFLSDAIVVTPDAPRDARWQTADIQPAATLIEEVATRHGALRTIAFGFSRGAYFVFGLGLQRPGVVDAVIPHSGGLVVPVPNDAATKAVPYYVIHGDADQRVRVEESRRAVDALKRGGVKTVEYDEIKGLAHSIDPAASERAFAWVARTLGPMAPALSAADVDAKLKEIKAAARAEDWTAAADGFDGLRGAPGSRKKKIASLAKTHVRSKDEGAAVAALGAAGATGLAGLSALKKGLADARDAVTIAAANGLGQVGTDASVSVLLKALKKLERKDDRADAAEAVRDALSRITGESFGTYAEWRRGLAKR